VLVKVDPLRPLFFLVRGGLDRVTDCESYTTFIAYKGLPAAHIVSGQAGWLVLMRAGTPTVRKKALERE
jgi:hypothetical protein